MRRAHAGLILACLAAAGGGSWLAHRLLPDYRAGDFSAQFDQADTQAILYSVQGCASCPAIAARLKAQGVRYVERDLDAAPEHHQRFQAMAGQYIPSLVLRDRVYEGKVPEPIPLP